MDFSWVKDLADRTNALEAERQARERAEKLMQRQLALATAPFVEKLQLLISTCGDEFNKYVNYPLLKVVTTRIQKKAKAVMNAEDPELMYPDEVAYFTFSRQDWTYGVRGNRGAVEFVEVPTAGTSMQIRLDEAAAAPSRRLVAVVDEESDNVVWQLDGHAMDGQAIVSLCREFFLEFIEKTHPKPD